MAITCDFKEIVRRINDRSILLPDFQRDFVWKDEEMQKKIVASVLAKMPIGSILLLSSDPNEYSSKIIGCRNNVDISSITNEVDFLLDGQQRITVLSNVFSNVIHDNCSKVSELISYSLKKRFFLKLPKWKKIHEGEDDLFGIKRLFFPIANPDSDEPDFLSSEIYPMIEVFQFNVDDGKPYNPAVPLDTALDDLCISNAEGYLIPLFLMIPVNNKTKRAVLLRWGTILAKIGNGIADEVMNYFVSLASLEEKKKFVSDFLDDKDIADNLQRLTSEDDLETNFQNAVNDMQTVWVSQLRSYLESCINSMYLSQIHVDKSRRGRAIDIYENLNLGGVSLNTFDLIMARVASVSKENFQQRLIKYMKGLKKYPEDVLEDSIKKIIIKKFGKGEYNATLRMKSYDESKNEIDGKYLDAFLDVLGLFCNNEGSDPMNYKVEHIKRDQILKLTGNQINDHCEKVVEAMDRALFFFQTRCGIRRIREINYALMLVLVATVFLDDTMFKNKEVHELLEAWYWSVIFSGEYDKDQNTRMIRDLNNITNTIKCTKKAGWLSSITNNVFDMKNFSDKELLLMQKVDEDRYPKLILRQFVCQYYLSKTYMDMFDDKKVMSVFSEDPERSETTLEAHHIIPLGSTKTVGQVTSDIRKDPKNICNSPLNFVYISNEANKKISDDPLDKYEKKIQMGAKAALEISAYKSTVNSVDDVRNILENRFNYLKGSVQNEINGLLSTWK